MITDFLFCQNIAVGEISLNISAATVMMLINAPAKPKEKTVALFCEMYFFIKTSLLPL